MRFASLDLQVAASSYNGPMILECVLLLAESGQAGGRKVVSGIDFAQNERWRFCLLESRNHGL